MNTVYFNDYNSWKDFSLILSSHTIESPTPKTEKIDVAGADGDLDYTEYFGEVRYNNRKIVLNFTTFGRANELSERLSEFLNVVHGQSMNITITDDSDFYYVGRIEVKTPTVDKNIMKIQVECDCEPYKYAVQETVIKRTLLDGESITLDCTNLRKTVIPTIVTNSEISISFGNVEVALSAGRFISSQLVFKKGSNIITVTSLGKATFEIRYREGGL